MPVDDHPIHPSTQKGKDFRYGCWNRKQFADGYYAPQRFTKHRDPNKWHYQNFTSSNEDFEVETIFVQRTMSTDCKYDLSHKDAACEGCKHKETK